MTAEMYGESWRAVNIVKRMNMNAGFLPGSGADNAVKLSTLSIKQGDFITGLHPQHSYHVMADLVGQSHSVLDRTRYVESG